MSDYSLLEPAAAREAGGPVRGAWRTAAGLLGALFLTFAAISARGGGAFRPRGGDAGFGSFVPRNGVSRVLVQPGLPGPGLLLGPALFSSPSSCVFLYGAQAAEGEEEGWVYGARLSAQSGLATPSGLPSDILKGSFSCYGDEAQFERQMLHAQPAARAGEGAVQQGEVWVVRSQGSVIKAFWFFQDATLPAPALRTAPFLSKAAGWSSTPTRTTSVSADPGKPALLVFDLDECLWRPEMYTLYKTPDEPIYGDLNGRGQGVVAVRAGEDIVHLYDGALAVLQDVADGRYPQVRCAAASSANTLLAVKAAKASLSILEVLPGLTIAQLFARGWPAGFSGHLQIGREGKLSPDKVTHFTELRRETGVDWPGMLYFDDCIWDDNCNRVQAACPGVVCVETPKGLTPGLFKEGLARFAAKHGAKKASSARPAIATRAAAQRSAASSSPPGKTFNDELLAELGGAIAAATGRHCTLALKKVHGSGDGGGTTGTIVDSASGKQYFVKVAGAAGYEMLEAEFVGVQALQSSKTVRVPTPIAHGSTQHQAYVVFEQLVFGKSGDAAHAGRLLAKMHKHTSPNGQFGFAHSNYLGATRQPNGWYHSWAEFWDQQRLGYMLDLAKQKGASFPREQQLRDKVRATLEKHAVVPSLLHGDLWSGNQDWTDKGEYAVFDPAPYYGDREADLAMTQLFGAQPSAFYAGYREEFPQQDALGYELRKVIYNLYHVLNHFIIFGPSYLPEANSMIEQILRA